MSARECALALLGFWLLVFLAGYGRLRLWLLQRALDRDWQALVTFARALDELAHSAGADEQARAVLAATAPRVALQAEPALRAEFADPAARPDLRGRLLPIEQLLQAEMKRLRKAAPSFRAWLFEGAAGVVLVAIAGPRVLGSAGRRRRCELMASPVVDSACIGLATLVTAFAVGLAALGLGPVLLRAWRHFGS